MDVYTALAAGGGVGFLYFAIRYLISSADQREKAKWLAEFSEFMWLMLSFLILLAVIGLFEAQFDLDNIAQQYMVRSVSLIRLFHYMGREIMGSLYFLTYTFTYAHGQGDLISLLTSATCSVIINDMINTWADLYDWDSVPDVCHQMCSQPGTDPVLVLLNFLTNGALCMLLMYIQVWVGIFGLSVSNPVLNFLSKFAANAFQAWVSEVLSLFLRNGDNLISEFLSVFRQAAGYSGELFTGPGMGLVTHNQFIGSLLNSVVFFEVLNYSIFSFYFFVTSPQMILLAALFLAVGKLRRPGYILAATYFSFKVLFPIVFLAFSHPDFLGQAQWEIFKDSLPSFIVITSPGIESLWQFEFTFENIYGEHSECEQQKYVLESIFPEHGGSIGAYPTTVAEDVFLTTLMKTRYFFMVEKLFLFLNVFTTGGSFLYALFASLSYIWGFFLYPAQGVALAMKYVSLLMFFLFGPPQGWDSSSYFSGNSFGGTLSSYITKFWSNIFTQLFLGNFDPSTFFLPIMGTTAGRGVAAIMTPGFIPPAAEVHTIPADHSLNPPAGGLFIKCLIQGFTKTADVYLDFLSHLYVVVFVYSFFLPMLAFVAATASALSIARQMGEEFYLPSIIGWI